MAASWQPWWMLQEEWPAISLAINSRYPASRLHSSRISLARSRMAQSLRGEFAVAAGEAPSFRVSTSSTSQKGFLRPAVERSGGRRVELQVAVPTDATREPSAMFWVTHDDT